VLVRSRLNAPVELSTRYTTPDNGRDRQYECDRGIKSVKVWDDEGSEARRGADGRCRCVIYDFGFACDGPRRRRHGTCSFVVHRLLCSLSEITSLLI